MTMKQLITLVLLAQVVILGNILWPSDSYADTRTIECRNWDDPNTRSCEGISPNEIRSLVKDINDIEVCRDQLNQAPDPTTASCDTDSFSCTLNDPAVACTIKGVSATTFNVSCERNIDPLTGDDVATCDINNEIGALANGVNDPSSNVGALLTEPQVILTTTLLNACEQRFSLSPSLQSDCDRLLSLLDDAANGDSETAAASAIKAAGLIAVITPDGAGVAIDVSQTAIRAQNRNIAQRINYLRRAAKNNEQVSFNGLQIRSNGKLVDMQQLYPELRTATGGGASGDALGGRLGIFLNGMIDGGEKDTTDNERGFNFSGGELTGGVDYRFGDDVFAGMAFGYSSNSTELNDNRGSLDSLAYNLIFYGSFFPNQNTYLDANIIIGGGQYDQNRNIKYSYVDNLGQTVNVDQVAKAKYFGEQFSASLSTGYDFNRGAWTMSPYGTLLYVKSQTDGYSENVTNVNNPGAGFALSIDDQEYTSTSLALGGQFTYALKYSWGVMLPQTKLEWIKEFQDDIQVVTGHFIGDPNNETFRLPSDKPDDAYFLFGLGATGIIPGGQTFYVYYQTYLDYADLSYYSLNLGVRWEFE